VSAPQPLTGDELATIKARTEADLERGGASLREIERYSDALRLVAEVERLRAQVERATTVRNAWRNPRGNYGCEECSIWEDLDAALDRDHAAPNPSA
jgi:hypothetical protein